MEKIGRFEVVRPLGRGGMGQVFLARDPNLERSVAIKVLNADSPDTRVLFESEAKALAALSHPNIVTIFEIAEVDGQQYIAMEYLPGKSLRELLVHDRPPRDRLVAICAQVATALVAAHAAKILHRDIKPENVVVGDRTVKVVDFGIARRLGRPSIANMKPASTAARATELVDAFKQTARFDGDTLQTTSPQLTAATNTVFGTPAYMAPEVLMGEASSPASDTYSLGVMVYECLTGKRPYDAPDLHSVIARVIDGEDHPARLSDSLGALLEQMIDRDPAKRPELATIAKALGGESTIASRAAQRPWLIPGLAVLAILAVGLGVFAIRQGRRDTPARLAIPIIEVTGSGFVSKPSEDTISRVLDELVKQSGVDALLVPQADHGSDATIAAAARRGGATAIVRGKVVERDKRLVAELQVVDLSSNSVTEINASSELSSSGPLLEEVAGKVIAIVKPGATLDRASNPTHATWFFDAGLTMLEKQSWTSARIYLEQAVHRDPSSGEAWDRLSEALERGGFRDQALRARTYALETSKGPYSRIMRAAQLVGRREYSAVFAELEPLEDATLSQRLKLDRWFWLGEAHWHEGRHDRAYEYFLRIIDADPNYLRAVHHAGEYAIARRMEAPALRFLGLQRVRTTSIDFALRRHDELLRSDDLAFRSLSRIVVDDPAADEPTSTEPQIVVGEAIAIAAGKDDRAAIARETKALIELARTQAGSSTIASDLVLAIETVLVGGYAGPTRDLLAALQEVDPTSYNHKRLSIVAGPLIGAAKFPRDALTERLAKLAEAIDAELAGDRGRTVEILDGLVKNPTYEWDYPERMALIRNLRAIERTAAADAICKDTLEPAVMRRAYRAMRRICGGFGVRRE